MLHLHLLAEAIVPMSLHLQLVAVLLHQTRLFVLMKLQRMNRFQNWTQIVRQWCAILLQTTNTGIL
jgi:hypothetical protein